MGGAYNQLARSVMRTEGSDSTEATFLTLLWLEEMMMKVVVIFVHSMDLH